MKKKENVIEKKSTNDINYEFLKKLFPHAVSIGEGVVLANPGNGELVRPSKKEQL